MWLGALVFSGLTLAVVVIGLIANSSGGDDAKVASVDTTDRKRVTVVIAGTNDALEPVTDGGITGEGTFRATGAITDSGTARGYRWLKGDEATGWQISLRYVTTGRRARSHMRSGSIRHECRLHRDGRSSLGQRRTKGYWAKATKPRTPRSPPVIYEGRYGADTAERYVRGQGGELSRIEEG